MANSNRLRHKLKLALIKPNAKSIAELPELLMLASYVDCIAKQNDHIFPKLEIVVTNSIDSVDADIVGFSDWLHNHSSCLEQAKKAKEKNAFVVFGGPYASAMANTIDKKYEFIDSIVVGHGFRPLCNIVKKLHKGKAVNKKIVADDRPIALPAYDLSYVDSRIDSKNKAIMFASFGCIKQKPCIFCNPFPFMTFNFYKEQFEKLNSVKRITIIDEVMISFCNDKLVNAAKNSNSKLEIVTSSEYFYADSIDYNSTIKKLEKLEDKLVAMHYYATHADKKIWQKARNNELIRHGSIKLRIKNTVKSLLNNTDAVIHVYFTLGLPGETEKTLKQCLDFAYSLVELGKVKIKSIGEGKSRVRVYFDLPDIVPGTQLYEILKKHSQLADNAELNDTVWQPEVRQQLLHEAIHYLTKIEYDDIVEAVQAIKTETSNIFCNIFCYA